MTTTADSAIAIARSMESWTYVLGGFSEGAVDCLGLDLKVLEKLGRPAPNALLSNFPRYVPSMVDHWLGQISYNIIDVESGDFPVFGDPKATDVHLLYAHTGVASTPGNIDPKSCSLVSALNATLGIRETTYAGTGLKFVLVLKTGFAKEGDMVLTLDPTLAVGTFTLNGYHQVYDLVLGKAVGNYPPNTKWPCFGKAPAALNPAPEFKGQTHWLVQPPDIGHLCAEGDAGGTFTPTADPQVAIVQSQNAALQAKIDAAQKDLT